MPSSAVFAFSDPDEYAVAIRGGLVELTLAQRGKFAAKLTRIDFDRLWMQRFSENLARVVHAANMAGRAMVLFRTTPGPTLSASGLEMHPSNIVRHSVAESYYQRSSASALFAAMSLPVEDLAAVGGAMAEIDLTPPRDASLVFPSPSTMARLQRLHAAAGALAEDAPEIITQPEAARGSSRG